MKGLLTKFERVRSGEQRYSFLTGDSFSLLKRLPQGSVDLILGSPPYEDARRYGELMFKRKGEGWVEWMVEFFRVAVPVSRGLVVMVAGHGKTDNYEWSATPAMLMADLKRAGFHLRCPAIFHRVGVCGSGQGDYWRYDYEFCVVVQNGERRLPWANNCAGGKPPKWAPGGEMSNRLGDDTRRNQWGSSPGGASGVRKVSGERQGKERPSHKTSTRRRAKGERERQGYRPPVLSNPGTVLPATYTARDVDGMLAEYQKGIVQSGTVGGGQMGHSLAHKNEAPYPLWLAERFVLTFCPPGGLVLDPFSGSGTTVHAAVENRRRGIGIDEREDQSDLGRRRLSTVTPKLFVQEDDDYTKRLEAKAAPEAEGADRPGRQEDGLLPGMAGCR